MNKKLIVATFLVGLAFLMGCTAPEGHQPLHMGFQLSEPKPKGNLKLAYEDDDITVRFLFRGKPIRTSAFPCKTTRTPP